MQNTEILTINYNDFSQDHWNEKESKNVKVVIDFFQHLMNEHDFDYILKNYGSTEYIQHNRAIPDGMQGLVNYIKNLT
jgi:predicted SnoaL-like aldol condensation-catalyzing enzyme